MAISKPKSSRTTTGRNANTTSVTGFSGKQYPASTSKASRTTTGTVAKTSSGKKGGFAPISDTGKERINDRTRETPAGTPITINAVDQLNKGGNSITPLGELARGGNAGLGAPASGANTGLGADGRTQDLTGWARGIRPDAIPMMYQEPQALLRQVMAKMGISAGSNPGLYNMALPNADLVNALALISLGADPGFEQGNHDAVLNFMGDYFAEGMTPGGQTVDFGAGIDNIMNAGADTALAGYLNLDDPRGQVQAVKSLIGPLAQAGLHPLFARALDAQINRLADEYYQEYGFGSNPRPNFQSNIGRLF